MWLEAFVFHWFSISNCKRSLKTLLTRYGKLEQDALLASLHETVTQYLHHSSCHDHVLKYPNSMKSWSSPGRKELKSLKLRLLTHL